MNTSRLSLKTLKLTLYKGILIVILNIKMKSLSTNIWSLPTWNISLIRWEKLKGWRMLKKRGNWRKVCYIKSFHWEKSININISVRLNNTTWRSYHLWKRSWVRRLLVKILEVIKISSLNPVNLFNSRKILMNLKELWAKIISIVFKLMMIMLLVMETCNKL